MAVKYSLYTIIIYIGRNGESPVIIMPSFYFLAKMGELQAAVQSFERSLELAKVLDDEPSQEAIKKALEDVNAQIVGEIKQENESMESEAVPVPVTN